MAQELGTTTPSMSAGSSSPPFLRPSQWVLFAHQSQVGMQRVRFHVGTGAAMGQ